MRGPLGAGDEDGPAVTDRHPMDCYLTPPCAARAIGIWTELHAQDAYAEGDWLDPFGGPGTLPAWMLQLEPEFIPDIQSHVFELDTRWNVEQAAYAHYLNRRVGYDSLTMPWLVRSGAPNIITNPPFGETAKALTRCREHAYDHRVYACALMRTDWWQHDAAKRWLALKPDRFLLLGWRPAFSWRMEPKSGRLVWSTDYAGYVWCVWEPRPTGHTEVELLVKPTVPKHLALEHKRLARIAYDMGHGPIEGA